MKATKTTVTKIDHDWKSADEVGKPFGYWCACGMMCSSNTEQISCTRKLTSEEQQELENAKYRNPAKPKPYPKNWKSSTREEIMTETIVNTAENKPAPKNSRGRKLNSGELSGYSDNALKAELDRRRLAAIDWTDFDKWWAQVTDARNSINDPKLDSKAIQFNSDMQMLAQQRLEQLKGAEKA